MQRRFVPAVHLGHLPGAVGRALRGADPVDRRFLQQAFDKSRGAGLMRDALSRHHAASRVKNPA